MIRVLLLTIALVGCGGSGLTKAEYCQATCTNALVCLVSTHGPIDDPNAGADCRSACEASSPDGVDYDKALGVIESMTCDELLTALGF